MKAIGSARLQRVLQEARETYRTLVEQVPAIIYTDAPDLEDDGVYVSPYIKDVLGITRRAFLETDAWIDMLHPDDRERVLRGYEEHRRGGPDVDDYRVVRPDGRVVWIRDRAKVVRDEDSGLVLEHGVLFDITDLKRAEEVIARQVELLTKVDRIGRDFTDLVLHGASLRTILDGLAAIAGNPAVLEDSAHTPIEFSGPEAGLDRVLVGWQAHSRGGHEGHDAGATRETTTPGCAWIPIMLRDEPWGRLHLLETGRAIDEVDLLALDRAAAAVSLSLLSERDAASPTDRAGSALLLGVLQGRFTPKEILQRARSLGAELDSRALACLAVALRGSAEPDADRGGWARELRRRRADVLREVRDTVVAAGCVSLTALDGARVLSVVSVPAGTPPREVLTDIGREIELRMERRLGLGAVVGAAIGVQPDGLRRGLEEAIEAAAFGIQAGGSVHFFADLGIQHLIARLSEGPELARFVESTLKPLLDHDAKSSSPLIPTLRVYLDRGRSKAPAARALHIDRRTLYHRLERIERMIGRDLDDGEANLELGVALRGLDVLRRRAR